jgi:hypothetical protein
MAGDQTHCPQCDTELTEFDHRPLAIHTSQETFAPTTNVIFEFTPSGICVSHPLQSLLILGRALGPAPPEVLDLTPFDGHKLGVSRRHCIVRRRSHRLVVCDLGSANGTYLNGDRLTPQQEYTLEHGDKLALGELCLTVLFGS